VIARSRLLLVLGVVGACLAGAARADDDGSFTIGPPGCRVVNPNPIPNESIRWSGGCRDGLADGQGTLDWLLEGRLHSRFTGQLRAGRPDGHGEAVDEDTHQRYVGEYRQGRYDGPGVLEDGHGGSVKGHFEGGLVEGDGEAVHPDGMHYRGHFHASFFDGQGVLDQADGTHYVGGFKRGKPEGAGVLSVGGAVIHATWRDGSPDGAVVVDGPGIQHYEGQLVGGLPGGHGKRTYVDGVVYEGEFAKGQRSGQGALHASDGTLVYEGGWKDDLFDGQGRLRVGEDAWYDGQMRHGVREGHGKLVDARGTLEGEFSAGGDEVRGVMTYPSGERQEGLRRGDQWDGPVRVTGVDGTVTQATFVGGLLEGMSVTELPDGGIARGRLHAGVREGTWEFVAPDGRTVRRKFLHGQEVPDAPAEAPAKARAG